MTKNFALQYMLLCVLPQYGIILVWPFVYDVYSDDHGHHQNRIIRHTVFEEYDTVSDFYGTFKNSWYSTPEADREVCDKL